MLIKASIVFLFLLNTALFSIGCRHHGVNICCGERIELVVKKMNEDTGIPRIDSLIIVLDGDIVKEIKSYLSRVVLDTCNKFGASFDGMGYDSYLKWKCDSSVVSVSMCFSGNRHNVAYLFINDQPEGRVFITKKLYVFLDPIIDSQKGKKF